MSDATSVLFGLEDEFSVLDAQRVDAATPETTRLATTIQTWWPAILVALTHDVSNARTEGFNRVIKQTKRVGCGFRSEANYQRRILSHIVVTRPQRSAA
jgi:transposase